MQAVCVIIYILALGCYGTDVLTPLGAIHGYLKTSHKGNKFSAFEGIPYAKPPIGERRFEPPEPVEPWHGIWNANFLSECAQVNSRKQNQIIGDEDCLHINVYVPRENPNSSERLDVIAHIHGGGYMIGSSHLYTNAEMLMDHDVIFVTFNYRLGILGFLSTEDKVLPGNVGMKDQVMALEWIQKYITNFGGNPDSVTLTGFSAGASSVHLHYFSEMSRGLFHRGTAQSGVALAPWSIQEKALKKTKILGKALGCPLEKTLHLAECLKQKSYKQILEKLHLFQHYKGVPFSPFSPVIEKSEKAFLSEDPYDLLAKGKVQDLPLIISSVLHEAYFPHLLTPEDIDQYTQNWDSLMPVMLDFHDNLDKTSQALALKKIRHFYFGTNETGSNIEKYIRLLSDRTFLVDAEVAAKMQAKVTQSPVYYYYFAYLDSINGNPYIAHGSDVKYYYGSSESHSKPLSPDELKMSSLFLEMFTSYAKTGVPKISGVEWKPTSHDRLTYLYIDSFVPEEITLRTVDELTPTRFWDFLRKKDKIELDRDEL